MKQPFKKKGTARLFCVWILVFSVGSESNAISRLSLENTSVMERSIVWPLHLSERYLHFFWDHVLSLKGCNVEWIYRKCSNALEFLVMDLTQWFSSVMWKRGNNRFSTLPSFCCYSTLTAAPMQEYKSMMQFSQWHNWTPDSFFSTCLAFSFPLIARRAFLGVCLFFLIKETTADLIVRHSLQNHSIYCK